MVHTFLLLRHSLSFFTANTARGGSSSRRACNLRTTLHPIGGSALLAWTHVVTNARFGGQDISSKYSSATTVCICALNIYHIKHAYIPGPHYSTSGRNKYIVMPTTTWSIAGRSTACPMVASASKNEAGCRRHVCARRGTEQAERKNATIDTK